MRTRLFSFCFSALIGLLVLGLIPANANSSATIRFRLTEPAMLAETALPAGTYTAHQVQVSGDFPVLLVESENGVRVFVPVQISELRHNDTSAHVLLQREDGLPRLVGFQFEGEPTSFSVLGHSLTPRA
ncbi:MAG: hypothetical protein HY821_08980 [Acidobacteria bacterium]|nr:hypothetical protein [Acidobacteriota bacterium]